MSGRRVRGHAGAGIGRGVAGLRALALLESVQRGLHSRGYHGGPLVLDPSGEADSEHPVAHIKQQVLASLSERPELQQHVG